MWLRTILIIIVLVLLVRALTRLTRGVMQGVSGTETARRSGASAVHMVADPVCGTFVVPGKALQLARGGETHHFCSTTCRDQWEQTH